MISRRFNTIHHMKDQNGKWSSQIFDLRSYFINHYNKILFSSSHNSIDNMNFELFQFFSQCISLEDNNLLCSILDYTEIKDVLFAIYSFKAPRLDGILAFVYKLLGHSW